MRALSGLPPRAGIYARKAVPAMYLLAFIVAGALLLLFLKRLKSKEATAGGRLALCRCRPPRKMLLPRPCQ